MTTWWTLGLILLGSQIFSVVANTDSAIFEMLVKNYKPDEAPDRYGSRTRYVPVEVQVMVESIEVEEFSSADCPVCVRQTVELQLLQRLSWTDVRLRHRSAPAAGGIVVSQATAGYPEEPRIWIPILLYPRAIRIRFDNSMDNFFKIRPNGTITWQRRVMLRVPCKLHLSSFPWDSNTCRASIRQNLDHAVLMLNWTENAYQPLYAGPHLSLPGFSLTSLAANSRTPAMDGDDDKSVRSKVLTMRFKFKRVPGYYIINDILPTSIIVLCCYTTFWLAAESVVVRALVSSFMLLAAFVVTGMATRAAPQVAVLKALDIWNGVCVLLVLWAMLQSLAVYRMSLRAGSKAGTADVPQDPPKPPEANGTDEPELPPPPPAEDLGPLPPRPRRRRPGATFTPRIVDIVARVLYPLSFCVLVATFSALYSS